MTKPLVGENPLRSRALHLFFFTLAIWAPVYSVLMVFLSGEGFAAITTMIATPIAGLSTLLARRGIISLPLAGNWLCFVVFTLMLLIGGVYSYGPPPLMWLAALPMVALLTANRSSAIFWLVASILATIFFYYRFILVPDPDLVLDRTGLLIFDASVLIGLFALVFLLSMAYEKAKDESNRELLASEEQNRKIVENAADAILTVGTNSQLHVANEAFSQIFSLGGETVSDRYLAEFVPALTLTPPAPSYEGHIPQIPAPETHPAPERLDLRSWAGRCVETTGLRADGQVVPIEVAIERLDQQELALYVVVIRDITYRKRLEEQQKEALERSLESFRALIENLPDCVIAHRDDTIYYANPATRRLLGFPDAGSLQGEPMSLVIPAQEWTLWQEAQNSLEGGETQRLEEHHLVHQNGEKVPVESTTFEAPFQDQLSQISILRDLTDRKKMRMKMMQMERMSAVGTLAAGVAHEINNPLTFVSGNLELLADALKHPDRFYRNQHEWAEAMQDALEGAERIRKIVTDLRTYSGQRHEAIGPVDLEEILETSISMATNEIKHRATLVRHFEEVPPALGEPAGLGQIALNLLINAAHAIPSGNAAENQIIVRLLCNKGQVVFEVEDTGTGISEDIVNRIFDPFFTTKENNQGTGLGLSICQNIIKQFRGEISVTSTEGVGTTFRVALPAVDPDSQPVDAPDSWESLPALAVAPGTHRVLIVDDEPKVASVLRRALSPTFDVAAMTDADRAIEALRNGDSFDAILCDLMMPGTSGPDFYRHLMENHPEHIPRLIFITGGAVTAEAESFLANPELLVLTKPVHPEEVRRHVLQIVEQRDDT